MSVALQQHHRMGLNGWPCMRLANAGPLLVERAAGSVGAGAAADYAAPASRSVSRRRNAQAGRCTPSAAAGIRRVFARSSGRRMAPPGAKCRPPSRPGEIAQNSGYADGRSRSPRHVSIMVCRSMYAERIYCYPAYSVAKEMIMASICTMAWVYSSVRAEIRYIYSTGGKRCSWGDRLCL